MKAEEMLRREMHRALDEMPDELDLETRFDARRRRHRRIQVMQMVTAAAVFAAIAVSIVPRVVGSPSPDGFSTQVPEPTPSGLPSDTVTDATVGYEVTLPDGWTSRVEQGALTAMGPREAGSLGEKGSANVPSQFYVLVTPTELLYQEELDRLRTFYEQLEAAGAQTTETQTTVAEHPAVSWGVLYPEDRSEQFAGDEGWCPGCRVSDYLVNWSHGYTIRIEVVARSTEANEQWYPEGLQVVTGFKETVGEPYEAQSGEVADGVVIDDATETLLQFMDARIAGEGAEMWLSSQLMEGNYDGELYGLSGTKSFTSYRVLRRDQADANSYEYVVEIMPGTGGEPTDERLFLGPGSNHRGTTMSFVIRSAIGSKGAS